MDEGSSHGGYTNDAGTCMNLSDESLLDAALGGGSSNVGKRDIRGEEGASTG